MTGLRRLALVPLALVLSTHAVESQERLRDRDFQLGGSVASVAALSGAPASEAKTIHLRPALTQDLKWRSSIFVSGSTTVQTDPVEQIVFSFYNDQLFRLVVDDDRRRTEGMTDADMIEAASAVYGPIALPARNSFAGSCPDEEPGTSVARWGASEARTSQEKARPTNKAAFKP